MSGERVAWYVRVSRAAQVQAETIDQQLERLHAYSQAHGWAWEEQHLFRDDGYTRRPARRGFAWPHPRSLP